MLLGSDSSALSFSSSSDTLLPPFRYFCKLSPIRCIRAAPSGLLISLGGNVYVCGNKPDGDKWLVAIQDPQGDDYAAMVALSDAFAVTSGGYQRYFTAEDGTVYQHIINPKTGYPVQSDLLSVTVIADNGTMADAYSTALYVMGERGAIDFWRANADRFDVVMITTDGRLLYTPNLQDQITEPEGTTYDFQVIDR